MKVTKEQIREMRWNAAKNEIQSMAKCGFSYADIRLRINAIWSFYLSDKTIEQIVMEAA